MSNLAQEEADRFFNHKPSAASHPEDRTSDADTHSADEDDKPWTRTIRSGRNTREDPDPDLEGTDDDDDEELASNMATMTTTKTNYTIPSTVHFANTGPKGVIADAQNYHRARTSTFRRTLNSISDSLSLRPSTRHTQTQPPPSRAIREKDNASSGSDLDLDDDDEFMAQWRQQRLAELQEQFSTTSHQTSQSPARRRTYGALESVNATGYLNAIEASPKSTHVVVFLHDPKSEDSLEVEDELKMLAYKYGHVRFVRMHHEIADMETVEIPALLAYRGGDVFVTMSGVERDGLEDRLRSSGVLVR